MAQQISKVEYYSIIVPNKPGEGACLLKMFSDAGVNLIGLWGYPKGAGKAQVDVVPAEGKAFTAAVRKAKLKAGKKQTGFLVQGEDKVGAAGEVLEKLSAAKINVHAVQATSAGCGCFGMFLQVDPKDVRKAAKALGI
ncbi:MAG: hypothetical protein LLG20_19910 [Acidobacteriales bacterium]|nr:hypothetical protein [Terriglobales bacterium]